MLSRPDEVMARKQRLQPHAQYLMCAYKPEFGYWEAGQTWKASGLQLDASLALLSFPGS